MAVRRGGKFGEFKRVKTRDFEILNSLNIRRLISLQGPDTGSLSATNMLFIVPFRKIMLSSTATRGGRIPSSV